MKDVRCLAHRAPSLHRQDRPTHRERLRAFNATTKVIIRTSHHQGFFNSVRVHFERIHLERIGECEEVFVQQPL